MFIILSSSADPGVGHGPTHPSGISNGTNSPGGLGGGGFGKAWFGLIGALGGGGGGPMFR